VLDDDDDDNHDDDDDDDLVVIINKIRQVEVYYLDALFLRFTKIIAIAITIATMTTPPTISPIIMLILFLIPDRIKKINFTLRFR